MSTQSIEWTAWILTSALCTAACTSVGPNTIPRDQFDYGAAISSSAREQLLLNMVRLRYMESPTFLDVVSVINQYELTGNVNLSAGWNTSFTGGNFQSVGALAHWSDRPTITYTPISGQKFSRSLMTPLAPDALFALVQSGWPADLIFGLTVRSINGLSNDVSSPGGRRAADPRFFEVVDALKRLRDAGAMGMRLQRAEESKSVVMFYQTENLSDEAQRDLDLIREALGLEPDAKEARLIYGLVPTEPNEIAILTRSILEIMIQLSWCLEVPPEHIEQGRTGSTFDSGGRKTGSIITNGYGSELPETAFIGVRDRDYWFYLDDRDLASKRTFAFMQILLSLADTDTQARGPVISISN